MTRRFAASCQAPGTQTTRGCRARARVVESIRGLRVVKPIALYMRVATERIEFANPPAVRRVPRGSLARRACTNVAQFERELRAQGYQRQLFTAHASPPAPAGPRPPPGPERVEGGGVAGRSRRSLRSCRPVVACTCVGHRAVGSGGGQLTYLPEQVCRHALSKGGRDSGRRWGSRSATHELAEPLRVKSQRPATVAGDNPRQRNFDLLAVVAWCCLRLAMRKRVVERG